MEPAPQPARLRLLKTVALAACLLSLGQALAGARLMDYTYDEPFHLDWARRLVFSGETERRTITNFDSKTPMTAVNVLSRALVHRLGVRDSSWLRFSARLPGAFWLAGLFLVVWAIARRHFGEPAGLVALTFVAADPNLSAHAGLVTVDVVYALASLLTLAAAMAAYRRPSGTRCAALAATFAFACTAKFSAVLLIPFLGLPLLRLLPRFTPDRQERRRYLRALLAGALAGAVVFALLISATYGFIKWALPLDAQPWASGPMSALAQLAPGLRLPLPADFLSGVDICLGKEREKQIMVGILGHRGVGPVPSYFVAAWAFKTPVLLLLGQVAGLFYFVRRRALRTDGLLRLMALSLVVNLLYLSFVFRYQIGYRYAFMCLPLLAILSGAALAQRMSVRLLSYGALALVITGSLEQLPFVGNGVAFSNALVQPKRLAFRLLGHDSNLDYGQHREQAPRWIAASPWAGAPFNPIHPLPGVNLFSVSELGHPRQTYWLARIDPIAHLHHTVLVFDVDARQFAEYLDGARSPAPAAGDAAACADGAASAPLASDIAAPEGDSTLCLSVAEPVDLALTGLTGSAHFGPLAEARRLWDSMEPGTQSWYRLRPGAHVFGFMRGRGFRGAWRVAGAAPRARLVPGWRLSP
jgi:hypothetical protein